MWSLFSTKKKERKSKYEGIHVYGKYIKGRGIEFVYTFDGDVSGLVETGFIKTTKVKKKFLLKSSWNKNSVMDMDMYTHIDR